MTDVIQESKRIKKPKKAKYSTQQYLQIVEIKDDVVVLKDGGLRAVLLVSSVNFALKSEDEQNATVAAYISFLNSLDFPIQIVIQSRTLNIDNYLANLKNLERQQTNELLKIQTREYIQYVQELVELADIMTKKFYVIVPYSPSLDKGKSFFSHLSDIFSPDRVVTLSQERYKHHQGELNKRVDNIISGLGGLQLKSVRLDTPSLIELFYNSYNPDMFERQKLTNLDKIEIT